MTNPFSVNIIGLSQSKHQFDFKLDAHFFKQYGSNIVSDGLLNANVLVDKHETFIEVSFTIKGLIHLICDRSLEDFEYPLTIEKKMVYKYGDENKEISDDVTLILRDIPAIDVGQPIYEYIVLAVPMKKIHPRFKEEWVENTEGKIIYTSTDYSQNSNMIDPRWEILKKLK